MALSELALLSLSVGDTNVTQEELVVALNLLLYSEAEDRFVKVLIVEVTNNGMANFTVDQTLLGEGYLFDGGLFAVGQIQIVATKVYNGGKVRVGAVKSTGIHTFLSALERRLGTTCSVLREDCPDLDDPPPCPPDNALANADPNFEDDPGCTFPDGAGECGIDLELSLDIHLSCLALGFTSIEFCADVDIGVGVEADLTACSCNFFHNGAAGCVRNRGSQCCYSSSGALITSKEVQEFILLDCENSTVLH